MLSRRSFTVVAAGFTSFGEEEKDSVLGVNLGSFEPLEVVTASDSFCVTGDGTWPAMAATGVVRASDLVDAASIELSLFEVSLAIPNAEIPAALTPIDAGFPTALESACSMCS